MFVHIVFAVVVGINLLAYFYLSGLWINAFVAGWGAGLWFAIIMMMRRRRI